MMRTNTLYYIALAWCLLLPANNAYAQSASRGDVNGDGKVDVEDITALVQLILSGKTAQTGTDTLSIFSPEKASCLSTDIVEYYEGMVSDGDNDMLYTAGSKSITAIDYSDKERPHIEITQRINALGLGREDMRARGIACKDNYLYVTLRQTSSGPTENIKPSHSLLFEQKGKYSAYKEGEKLSNNEQFNSFFKKLRLKNTDVTQKLSLVYIYKGRYQNGQYINTIMMKSEDGSTTTITRQTFDTYDAAINALAAKYTNTAGDYCEVDWRKVTNATNTLKDITLNIPGEFDSFTTTEDMEFAGTTDYSPSKGECGLAMKSATGGEGLLTYRLEKEYSSASFSLWVKTEKITNDVEIPVLGKDGTICYKIRSEVLTKLTKKQWNNIKCVIEDGRITTYIRSQESANWTYVTAEKLNDDFCFNQLMMGLDCPNGKTTILVDNFYFDGNTNIDNVSYVNGKLVILDKETLDVTTVYHLDVKAIDAKVHGNRLVVTTFYGFNVYDISTPEAPVLKYCHRQNDFRESQNCELFEKEGRVYAFICNYHKGYTIVDITNLDHVSITKSENFSDYTLDGQKLSGIIYTFDVAIAYPLAYLTISTMRSYLGTDVDRRGVLTLNLSDFDNMEPKFSFAPKGDLTAISAGDPCPTRIAIYGNTLLLNNADKGLLLFDLLPDGSASYKGTMEIEDCTVNDIYVTESKKIYINNCSPTSQKKIVLYK